MSTQPAEPHRASARRRETTATSAPLHDARGLAVRGATPGALAAYERAAAAFLHWRGGAGEAVDQAIERAPSFTMAHVLKAWRFAGSRDPAIVRRARKPLGRASLLASDARERLHVAALAAVLADDYEAARDRLSKLLRIAPRDALALQVAHSLDYLLGDTQTMNRRIAAVLPAWSPDLAGHAGVLAMHAFALQESGAYAAAEQAVAQALAIDPFEPRAHHAMAHVFEMSNRAAEGARWLREHSVAWDGSGAEGSTVATHLWWHLALFELTLGHVDAALAIYDAHLAPSREEPLPLADLIDAASLLWRVRLQGGVPGSRSAPLANAWAAHAENGFCTFSDLHAMLAFVGARDFEAAGRLERLLERRAADRGRHAQSTRQVGLPASRALIAFGRGEVARAAALLARLPAATHRIGGSHAQRDVLQLTLARAFSLLAGRRRERLAVSRVQWSHPPATADAVLPGPTADMNVLGRPIWRAPARFPHPSSRDRLDRLPTRPAP